MQRTTWMSILAGSLLFAAGACGPDSHGGGDDSSGVPDAATNHFIDGGPNEFVDAGMAQACDKIDFLFIVDDSGSMQEEQTNLAANFPMFVNLIESYMTSAGTLIDYRIAVTTTGRSNHYSLDLGLGMPLTFMETGDNGAFRMQSSSGGSCNMTRRWFQKGDANIAQNFGCVAEVGTGGPSYEMPLLCSKLALSDRVSDGTNAGFLRDDALLAIIYISDEDDCSRTDDNWQITPTSDPCAYGDAGLLTQASFISFFDTLKGDPGRWAAAVIAAPMDCTSSFGDAVQARRMQEFVQMKMPNATFSSICAGDLTTALQQALDTFTAACESFPPIG
jgi:hypothetical protein